MLHIRTTTNATDIKDKYYLSAHQSMRQAELVNATTYLQNNHGGRQKFPMRHIRATIKETGRKDLMLHIFTATNEKKILLYNNQLYRQKGQMIHIHRTNQINRKDKYTYPHNTQ